MKHYIPLIFLIISCYTSEARSPFYIKGKILVKASDTDWVKTVYLLKISTLNQLFSGSIQTVVDSAVIKPDGTFLFKDDKVIEDSCFYRLNVVPKDYGGNGGGIYMVGTAESFAFLLLNKKSKIEITTELGRFNYALHQGIKEEISLTPEPKLHKTKSLVKMDPINNSIRQLEQIRRYGNEQCSLLIVQRNALDTSASSYKDSFKAINYRLGIVLAADSTPLKQFADTVSNPFATLLAVNYWTIQDTAFLERLSKRFHQQIPHSRYTEQFDAQISKKKYGMHIGDKAPEILMKDLNGKTIKLSGLRGQYVLVDFWASWCHPCRQEIKTTLKPLYQRYKTKGFTILAISQDKDKDNWIKAMQEDNAGPWIQTCDLKGQMSKPINDYKVEGLPSSFLIDRNGTIVAVNLREKDLEDKMAELLK